LFIDLEMGSTLAYKIAWMQQKGGMMTAASAALGIQGVRQRNWASG